MERGLLKGIIFGLGISICMYAIVAAIVVWAV